MLSREGVTHDGGVFPRSRERGCLPAARAARGWARAKNIRSGLRGIRQPDPIRLEDMVLYEKERGALVENTRRLLDGRQACNILLYGDKGTGKSATVKALLSSLWLEGLAHRRGAAGAADPSADDFLNSARSAGQIHRVCGRSGVQRFLPGIHGAQNGFGGRP